MKHIDLQKRWLALAAMLIVGMMTTAQSMRAQDGGNEPSYTLTPEKIDMAAGVVGKTTEVATLHVSAQNMPGAILLELTGANSGMFALSQSKIEPTAAETDIVITYTPTEVAKHKAYLTIDCPSAPELYKTMSLSAYAIDESNPPTVATEPRQLATFMSKAGESSSQTIAITTAHMPDYAYVKVKDAGSFTVSNTMLMRNATSQLTVTFKPKEAGTYHNEIIISALGMNDVSIPVEGIATATGEDVEKEGDDLVPDTTKPITLLDESFDNIGERNKPLKLEGWTNSAVVGTRAWWGYSFPDYDASAGEKVAKVTAYDSQLPAGKESAARMMLITPALDFRNAKSKVFTFRVRGDYLQDNQTDTLQLCYMDMQDDTLYTSPVGGFTMPCTKDESGEWFEYHLDLAQNPIADVFFMGFSFASTRGNNNAATYYIDDVTFGRTDIPVIRTDVTDIALETIPGKDAQSDIITVTTENTTEPVKLTLGGANKSKFKLSATELPAAGGTFSISFNALDEAIYSAYVKLSSRGAADKYVEIAVANSQLTDISDITATAGKTHVMVYDLRGNLVADHINATPADVLGGMAQGIYVVKTVGCSRIMVNKVRVR